MAKEQLGPYVVLVRELPAQRSFDISGATISGWLKGMPMRDALGAPENDADAGTGHAELELYVEGTHAFATGSFTGNFHVACSRCVGDVNIPIDEHLQVTFMPPNELPTDDDAAGEDGAEVATEDLDLFPFDGDKIDLEPLFREQYVLSVPYSPLCKEDCKGLCGQCGIDLNSGTCACEKPIDPRLAALKGLKLPS